MSNLPGTRDLVRVNAKSRVVAKQRGGTRMTVARSRLDLFVPGDPRLTQWAACRRGFAAA